MKSSILLILFVLLIISSIKGQNVSMNVVMQGQYSADNCANSRYINFTASNGTQILGIYKGALITPIINLPDTVMAGECESYLLVTNYGDTTFTFCNDSCMNLCQRYLEIDTCGTHISSYYQWNGQPVVVDSGAVVSGNSVTNGKMIVKGGYVSLSNQTGYSKFYIIAGTFNYNGASDDTIIVRGGNVNITGGRLVIYVLGGNVTLGSLWSSSIIKADTATIIWNGQLSNFCSNFVGCTYWGNQNTPYDSCTFRNYEAICPGGTQISILEKCVLPPPPPITSISLTSSQSRICLGDSVFVTVSLVGGTSPYNYLWSDGQTTAIATLGAGNYSVTVTDSNNQTITDSNSVNYSDLTLYGPIYLRKDGYVYSYLYPDSIISCNNSSVQLGVHPYIGGTMAFNWSNGVVQTGSIQINNGVGHQVLPIGNHSVTVTDIYGCTSSNSYSILPNGVNDVNIIGPNQLCAGSSVLLSAVIDSIANGFVDAKYQWSTGETTQSINVSSPGNFAVTVTNMNCSVIDTKIVTQTTISVNPTYVQVCEDITTVLYSNASVVNPMGATTYVWSTGFVSQNISTNSAGLYSVTVSNGACSIANSIAVSFYPSPIVSVVASDTLFCANQSSILSAIPGGYIAYSWSGGGTSAIKSVSTSGTYTVTVTGMNGCISTDDVSVTATQQPSSIAVYKTASATCSNTGSISLVPNGGTAPYSYIWSDGQTTSIATALVPNYPYSVTVTNGGCNSFLAETVGVTDMAFAINTTATCPSSFTGTLALTGGASVTNIKGSTGPYAYLWSNSQTTATITGLAVGSYIVTVTDAYGCTMSDTAMVFTQNWVVPSYTIVDSDCDSRGSVGANPANSNIAYYLWSNNQVGAHMTATSGPGTFVVTVTQPNSGICWDTDTITIGFVNNATTNYVTFDPQCYGASTGAIHAYPSGISNPQFSWSNGYNSSSMMNLAAGTYTVTITNGIYNCYLVDTVVINSVPQLVIDSLVTVNLLCHGDSDGSATVFPSGGTAPYSYIWSGGSSNGSISTGLSAGTYTVTVRDYYSYCPSTTTTINIIEPSILNVTTVVTESGCHNSIMGEIIAVATGGVSGYSYTWSNNDTTSIVTGLSSGNYFVTITDQNGCEKSGSATITNPTILSVTATGTNISCFNANDGRTLSTASGGVIPYIYAWSSTDSLSSLDSLSAGVYCVTVSDGFNCAQTACVTVSEPSQMFTSTQATNVLCYGENTGTASAVVVGGTPTYSYSWSIGNGQSIAGLTVGSYFVTVTDQNGCSTLDSVFITQPTSALESVSSITSDILCYGDSTAIVSIFPTGAISPYTYYWSTLDTIPNIVGVSAGNYFVTITDQNGCEKIDTVVVSEPSPVIVTLVIDSITATAVIVGGIPNYSYLWSNGQTTATITGLTVGSYIVTVTDQNGCFTIDSLVYNPLNIGLLDNDSDVVMFPNPTTGLVYIETENELTVTVQVINMLGQVLNEKEVTGPSGSVDLSQLPAATYMLRITAGNRQATKKIILLSHGEESDLLYIVSISILLLGVEFFYKE